MQYTVVPDPVITEPQTTSAMAPIEALQLEGLQFPGQEVKVKINQVLQSDSVEVNANETGFNIILGDLQQGSNLVRIEKHSSDGDLLKAIEFELMKPVVNEHLGFVGFDMPTPFFSLNRVGGAVSIDYDEVDEELVFYNSEQGVLLKRDSQNVMRLLTYLPNVSNENLQINSEDQFFRKILPYPMVSRDGVQYLAGQKGNFTRFTYDTYEPEPEIGLVVIRKFDGQNVTNIAGHNAQAVDADIAPRLVKDIDQYPGAKVFIPDTSFVGTNQTTAADALLLSSEMYAMVEIQGKIYFNQGDAVYQLNPANNTIRWLLGSPDSDNPVESQIAMPASTLTGIIQNLEKYDNSSLAISFADDEDINDSVHLYKVVVSGSSTGNFELLGTFGGGSDSIAGKNSFDPAKARLDLYNLIVHQQVPHFLAAPDDRANNSQGSEPPSLYKINDQGLAEKLMDPMTGFAETPAAINQLRHSPLALFSVGSDILMLNMHVVDMPIVDNSSNNQDEEYISEPVAASHSESGEYEGNSESSESADSEFSESFDFELEYNLLKSDGRVEFLMGSHGLFETGLIEETLLWPNGDMTLLLGPDLQATNELSLQDDQDIMDGYVVLHKQAGISLPFHEVSSNAYSPVSGESIAELIPWFNDGDVRILSVRGVGNQQRLIAINPANHQATNIGYDSDGFEEYLASIEDQTGSRPSFDEINSEPRAGSLDLNTLKYAADNQLGLKDIALPDLEHLDFSFDWQDKVLIILVKSESKLSFYEVDLESQNLNVSSLFTSDQLSLGTSQNEYTFDLATTEISLLGDELAITSNGSIIRVDLNDLNQSEIVMISSADTTNANKFVDLVDDFDMVDVVATEDGRTFALVKETSATGNINKHFIAQMIDLEPRVFMAFGSLKEGLPLHGANARTKIHGKHPAELQLLLGEPQLLVSNNHLFLLGRGQDQSSLLVIDDRQAANLNVSINNLSIQDSQSQTVEANDIIEFNYSPNNLDLDLYFEIGGNPVSYETGVAQLEVSPYTHGFSGNLLAGGVAKDRFGRNSQIFQGKILDLPTYKI